MQILCLSTDEEGDASSTSRGSGDAWSRLLFLLAAAGGKCGADSEQCEQFAEDVETDVSSLRSIGGGAPSGWGPPMPSAADSTLQSIISELYRRGATIGNGGTADAIRAGAGHVQKGGERIVQLSKWLAGNAGASQSDVHTAQSLLQDLISAMSGDGYPGS